MSIFLEYALRYAALHWPVMPLCGKNPITTHGCHDATFNSNRIRKWWERNPKDNVGLATNHKFWALDIDTKNGGDLSLEELELKHGKLPPTLQQETGTGGRHFLFAIPEFEVHNSMSKIAPGIDVRGKGGYIVAPPSIHPDNGRVYEWDGLVDIEQQEILKAPAWLLDAVHPKNNVVEPVPEKIEKGKQHYTLVSVAGSMRRRGLGVEEIFAALKIINEKRCAEPGSIQDIRKMAEAICRYAPGKLPTTVTLREDPPPKPKKEIQSLEFETPGQVITKAGGLYAYLESRNKKGIQTPWSKLNNATGGFHPGELIVLAAGTSKGKTAFALNLGYFVAKNKIGVAVISLEMGRNEVCDRLLCVSGQIDSQSIRRRPEDPRIERAADDIAEMQVFICDNGLSTTRAIRESVIALRTKAEIGLVVVDYLQLLSSSRKYSNRTEEVGALSRSLKMAAQELELPFLVLSQLNRTSGREKRPPELFDLRESGSIENDSDVVLFLHAEREYKEAPTTFMPVDLILAKQRNGPAGIKFPLMFRSDCGRFEEKVDDRYGEPPPFPSERSYDYPE